MGAAGARPLRALVVVAVAVAAAGCASTRAHLRPDEVPSRPRTPPSSVAVCGLVSSRQVSRLVRESVHIVGAELDAPRVPTYQCDWERDFAVPVVSVSVGAAAVSSSVFVSSYGPGAGGDPDPVHGLGQLNYARIGEDTYTVDVLLRGAVVAVVVQRIRTRAVPVTAAIRLTRAIVGRLPRNPRLKVPPLRGPCTQIDDRTLTDAIAEPPVARTWFHAADGSMVCSWSSRPGLVRVTVYRAPAAVRRAARQLDPGVAERIALGVRGWRADARTDVAGVILAFGPGPTLVDVTLVPTAGWADAAVPTTPAEIRLARRVLRAVG